MPLELLLDHIRVLQHVRERLLTQDRDDGAPGLPGEFNGLHFNRLCR